MPVDTAAAPRSRTGRRSWSSNGSCSWRTLLPRVRTVHVIGASSTRLDVLGGDGGGMWARRSSHAAALWATIGRGTCRWTPPIASDERHRLSAELLVTLDRCERLDDVAVPIALDAGVGRRRPRTLDRRRCAVSLGDRAVGNDVRAGRLGAAGRHERSGSSGLRSARCRRAGTARASSTPATRRRSPRRWTGATRRTPLLGGAR